MGLRQILNRYPAATGIAAVVLVVLLIGVRLISSRKISATPPTLSYFSADDGKTFFADDINQVAPFQRDGHEVDAACVFECNGKRFVGYLERAVSPEAAAYIRDARHDMLATATTQPQWIPDSDVVNKITRKLEIKKPGDSRWVKELSSEAPGVMTVSCADGTAVQVGP